MTAQAIDVKHLQSLFRLNPQGELERLFHNRYWRIVRAIEKNKKKYLRVNICGSTYLYHRVVWCLAHGEDIPPESQLDHINGDRHDNRLDNLRAVTQRGNSQNLRRHRDGSGLVGANLDKSMPGKWKSRLWIIDRLVHLGNFDSELAAHEMYTLAVEYLSHYQNPHQFRELLRDARSRIEEKLSEQVSK